MVPNRKVTWEVTVLPGFYALHTYLVEDLGEGRSRFGSWEKAMGPTFRSLKWFWVAHFVFVKDRSLVGARVLEQEYQRAGKLDLRNLQPKNNWRVFGIALALLLVNIILLTRPFNRPRPL